jgi:hypothetical protein
LQLRLFDQPAKREEWDKLKKKKDFQFLYFILYSLSFVAPRIWSFLISLPQDGFGFRVWSFPLRNPKR